MSEHLQLDTKSGRVKGTSSSVGTEPKPIDFSEVFVIGLNSGIGPGESGTTPLVSGQSYIDVVFASEQDDLGWMLQGCSVINTVDANPLNIWPGIMTSKTTLGFRIQLNGMPDSANYYLRWCITGIIVEPVEATTYTLSGPSTGLSGVASTAFTVALPPSTVVTGSVIVTMHDGGAGGTFTPATRSLTTGTPSATFTYTPSSSGSKAISVTNSGGLTNPGSLTYTVAAPFGDGDPVSTWLDSSGNGNHATNTGSARPIYKTAIVNGKPVVRFSSASSTLLNLATAISSNYVWTAFAVLKPAAPGNKIISLETSGDMRANAFGGSFIYTTGRDGFQYCAAPDESAFHVLTGQSQAPLATVLWFDGTIQSTTFFANPFTTDFITIGTSTDNGDIAEIIFYNGGLSLSDIANIEKYLGDKYGITVAGGGTAMQPDDPSIVAVLKGWWKADSGVS